MLLERYGRPMTTDDSQNPVAAAVAEAVGWYLDANPVLATVMGSDDPDRTRTLGDLTADGYERRARGAAAQLAKLDALAGGGGSGEDSDAGGRADDGVAEAAFQDGIDRDLVRAQLRRQGIMAERQVWRRDPGDYVTTALFGLYLPLEQKTRPEERLAEETLAKLKQVPEVLAACRRTWTPAWRRNFSWTGRWDRRAPDGRS